MVHLQTRGRCELGALAISTPFRTKKRTNRVRFEFENPRRNGIASTRQRIFRINASRHALADRLNSNNERRQWFDRYAKFHSSKLRSWANIYGLIQVTVLADSIGARNTTVREAFTHQLQGNLHKNYVEVISHFSACVHACFFRRIAFNFGKRAALDSDLRRNLDDEGRFNTTCAGETVGNAPESFVFRFLPIGTLQFVNGTGCCTR